jgi:hypothetical protein
MLNIGFQIWINIPKLIKGLDFIYVFFLSFFLVCPLLPTRPKCRELVLHLITHTHTKHGRTPLDEWSAHRRDFCLTAHNIHKRQTSMLLAGFEPSAPASERQQIYALNRATTKICWNLTFYVKIFLRVLLEVYAILILVIFSLFGDNSGPLSWGNVYVLDIIMGELFCLIGFLYPSCALTSISCPLPLFVLIVWCVLNDVLPIVCLGPINNTF